MYRVPEIVLTGGPCGGKTSALSCIQSWLMDRGYRVFLVPEVATMLINGGVYDIGHIAEYNSNLYLHFQRRVLEMEMALKYHFCELADEFTGRCVIIYDRGPMDGCAYLERSVFERLLKDSCRSLSDARDSFEAVIHLVTAAHGAEEHYTTANNTARRETPAEARELDERTQNAWVGHPHLKIIGNDPPGFESKMKRAVAAVAWVLGIPVPLEIERKFLLERMPDLSVNANVQSAMIEQMYLEAPEGDQLRIRKRTAADGTSVYYHTTKKETGISGIRNEDERMITGTEYETLSRSRKQGTSRIVKKRHCFVWEQQYFELDVFTSPSGCLLLEVELTELNETLTIPPFISVMREVTGERAFSNYELAKL